MDVDELRPEQAAVEPRPPDRCGACGTAPIGRFCSECGQRNVGRLDVDDLWRGMTERIFNLERGFLYTVKEMTLRPGSVVRRYIGGDRRSFVNPISYSLILGAASLIWIRLQLDEMDAFVREQLSIRFSDALTPPQIDLYADLQVGFALIGGLAVFVSVIPYTLVLRLTFRRSGLNLAEAYVFTLFTMAQPGLYGLLVQPFLLGLDPLIQLNVLLPISAFVGWHAGFGFFGRSFGTFVRVTLAMGLGYGLFLLLHTIAMLSIVAIAA